MARKICQTLLAIALGYLAALGLFALLAYEGPRPDVVTMAGDFHRFVIGRRDGDAASAPKDPGEVPPAARVPPPAPPTPDGGTGPDPAAAPGADPAATPEAPPLDERGKTLKRVRDDLVPEAERRLARLKPGEAVDMDDKAHARTALVEARDLLGALLDADRQDVEAGKLYRRVMELLNAVDKR
jgi:hypothetical protein